MLHEFVDQVEKAARSVMSEIHTAIPGKITSFNPATAKASVTPYGSYITGAGKKLAYPAIGSAPVVIPQCASLNAVLAFPIKSGDDCLIIISEKELDAWSSGGESENNISFDLSNAIVIPGLSSSGSAALQEACSDGSIVITNGAGTKIKVKKDKIEMKGDLEVDGNITATGSIG